MEQAELLERVRLATVDIMTDPGPLGERPRQIESYAKLDVRLNDDTYEGDPLKAYFDIAGGVGKTVMFGRATEKFVARGLRSLTVTPRIELVDQTHDKFTRHFDSEIELGVMHGKRSRKSRQRALETAQAGIITNGSLLSYIKSGQLDPKDWDVVNWDETHLALGPEIIRLIQDYEQDKEVIEAAFAHAFQIAYTASGEYNEAKSVAKIFGPPVDSINTVDAVEGNLLASIKTSIFRSRLSIGIDELGVGEDFDPAQLEKALNTSARNLIAPQLYANFEDPQTGYRMLDEQGMLFCAGVDHARQVAAVFNREIDPILAAQRRTKTVLVGDNYNMLRDPNAEISRKDYDDLQFHVLKTLWQSYERRDRRMPILPAVLIHGGTSKAHQELIHACFDHRLTRAVSNADMWTFGIDKPQATFAQNLTITTSLPKCIQRGTRVDRLYSERPNKVCYVIDVIDEDVWQRMQEAARDPKKVFRNAPRLFAQVLNWRTSVANACMPTAPTLPPKKAEIDITPVDDPEGNEPTIHIDKWPIEPRPRRQKLHIDLDPNQIITEHTLLEEIYNTYKEATEKQTIEITDEMRNGLEKQITRTGCGCRVIFKGLQESGKLPDGLKNYSMIESWCRSTQTADFIHWKTVMAWLSEQPNLLLITDALQEELVTQIIRTRRSYKAIFNGLKGSGQLPQKLRNAITIENWRNGGTKVTDEITWNAVMTWLKKQPDEAPRQMIPITDKMRSELRTRISNKGHTSLAIFKALEGSKQLPEKLGSFQIIENWRTGGTKNVDPLNWAAVMTWLGEQPDASLANPTKRCAATLQDEAPIIPPSIDSDLKPPAAPKPRSPKKKSAEPVEP